MSSIIGMAHVHGGVIFSTSYTAAEGYSNAPLSNNVNWVGGGQVAVRPNTTGFTTKGGVVSADPTYHVTGALDGSPGRSFGVGDRISIQTQLQFTLPGAAFAQEVARFGFSDSAGGGLQSGFGVVWDRGITQPDNESGFVRFFPDFNDYVLVDDVRPVNQANSFSIEGRYVGLDVFDTRGNGADLRSNPFEIDYTAEKTGSNEWSVIDLTIRDLQSRATFFYDRNVQPTQTFSFAGSNAFFGQRMGVQGRDGAALNPTSEFVTFSHTSAAVPEPGTIWIVAIGMIAYFIPRRLRQTYGVECGKGMRIL
ncbi:PEP-CTERM sorting domain-containing protein [Rubripirellula tenax]|nr:PEP-CTERM sorting domain-containing protein [Rubripirellula tenax]